ncbi:hypothetical protein C1645_834688 [Glomus cerebriforme]|uniref:TLDc domain-containing protein n=1 Tax=Glomus cerebriforme TaxID=658196 RepID=A0A397SA68_9GLOM|nr:hypothetical protein C1645_834688 [Glomus cerebriforme]
MVTANELKPNKIFNSPKFSSIPEKLLVLLIQNDNLQISEIQVWEHVLKWGLAQNPELPSDPTRFSKDDFNILKNTLQQCIPFIRFRNLTSNEFLMKVLPYKKIFPKDLYKDLLEYFIEKNIKQLEPLVTEEIKPKNIDSKIITFQHAELISKWIDKLEIKDKLTTSYEFKLLYRYNESYIKNVRKICENQSRTVVIIKVRDSNEILGGYNPIEWKFDDSLGITKDSFIFSFSNDSIENYILSRVKDENYAIYGDNYGISFGDCDLALWQAALVKSAS